MGQRAIGLLPPATTLIVTDLDIIRREPFNAETPEPALRHAETPARHVYVRSNFDMPLLDADHVITIDGLVSTPFAFTLADLAGMPQCSIGATMECAGNDRMTMTPLPTGEPWQSGALSTVSWRGVPLAALLDRAGVHATATEVLFEGADAGQRDDAEGTVRFQRSLPLSVATDGNTLLATGMNGRPLTQAHGAPVRVVVPGWYGMANVKWLRRITLIPTAFDGYFQRQRYVYDVNGRIAPVTQMRVKSVITSPAAGAECAPHAVVEGWAWSGAGAIARVDVAVDGGDAWQEAQLQAPASPFAWTPWRCDVLLRAGSRCTLRSRATDSTGATQPDAPEWNRLGYGNNAVRPIVVNVGLA